MAFRRKQDVGSGDAFKFEKVGQSLTGFYLGSFDHDGEYGPSKKHVFKTPKGLKVVFGQTHLTRLLEGEAAGTLMRVSYTGDKKMKKGNPMKEYSLEIDDEQKLDADEIPDQVEEAIEPEEYSQAEDEPTEVEEEEAPMDEVKTAPAKPLAVTKTNPAATKARLDAILNRTKKA